MMNQFNPRHCMIHNETNSLQFQMMEPLYEAIITGNTPEISFLLEAGVPVNSPFSDGLHPLTVAVLHGREDVTRILIEAGAIVNR